MTQSLLLTDLSCSERLTIWTVRRLANPHSNPRTTPATGLPNTRPGSSITQGQLRHCGTRSTESAGVFLPFFRADFSGVTDSFNRALECLAMAESAPLNIAASASLTLTRTERDMLEATSAAQDGADDEVRRVLSLSFPQPHVLARFASAITLLGACLAGAGHWLPRGGRRNAEPQPEQSARPTGAACLSTLSRWRRVDVESARILWPNSGQEARAKRLEAALNEASYI